MSALLLIWKDILLTSANWVDNGSTIYPLLWLVQSCKIKSMIELFALDAANLPRALMDILCH